MLSHTMLSRYHHRCAEKYPHESQQWLCHLVPVPCALCIEVINRMEFVARLRSKQTKSENQHQIGTCTISTTTMTTALNLARASIPV